MISAANLVVRYMEQDLNLNDKDTSMQFHALIVTALLLISTLAGYIFARKMLVPHPSRRAGFIFMAYCLTLGTIFFARGLVLGWHGHTAMVDHLLLALCAAPVAAVMAFMTHTQANDL